MKFYKEKFRQIRKQKKISLKKVTAQIGKSYRTLLAWEKGDRNPGESDIRILSQLLDISVSEISDLKELTVSKPTPYYHDALGDLERLQREFTGELSLEKQTYLLSLKNELEHMTAQVNMLKKINRRQKIVIDSLYTFIYEKDRKLKFVDANTSFLSYLNIPIEEIIGKKNIDLFAPKDFEELSKIEREVLSKGTRIVNREITIPGSNGRKRGMLSIYPVYGETEEVSRIVCSLTDISPLYAEQNRRKMMEFTINQLNDAVWIILDKPIPHFLFLSNAAAKIYGRPLDDFYKDHRVWQELIHPEDRKRVMERVNNVNDFPRKTQYRVIHPDGSIHWIESKAYKKLDKNSNSIVFGTLRDITKEKEDEAEKNLLHSVIDKFEEIVWIGSKNKQDKGSFKLHYINSKACGDIIGYSDEELIENPNIWNNSIHQDDKDRIMQMYEKDKFPRISKYRIIHKNKTMKYIQDREYRINDELYFGFIKDISEDMYNTELLEYFKDSVNHLNGVFWIKELKPLERIIFISNSIEEIIGFKPDELTSEIWKRRILESDGKRVEKAYNIQSERRVPLVYKIRHRDGTLHTVDEMWFDVKEVSSKTIKFGFIRDITKKL